MSGAIDRRRASRRGIETGIQPFSGVNDFLTPAVSIDFLLKHPSFCKETHREILYNENNGSNDQRGRYLTVTEDVAQVLLRQAEMSYQEALAAREKIKKSLSTSKYASHILLIEEAQYLEVVSNAICLLRRSNYMVQKELNWLKTRQLETKSAHAEFSKILNQCIREQEERLNQLQKELSTARMAKNNSPFDILPPNKKPDDRLSCLRNLCNDLKDLKRVTDKAEALIAKSQALINPKGLTTSYNRDCHH